MDFGPIDSVLTAEACGVRALHAETREALTGAVAAALADGEPLVVEVPIAAGDYRGIV